MEIFLPPIIKFKQKTTALRGSLIKAEVGKEERTLNSSINQKNKQQENNQKLTWIPRETSFRSEFQSSDLENKSSKTRSLSLQIWFSKNQGQQSLSFHKYENLNKFIESPDQAEHVS